MLLDFPWRLISLAPRSFDDSDLPPNIEQVQTYSCIVNGPVSQHIVVLKGVLISEDASWNVTAKATYRGDDKRVWERLIAVHRKSGKKLDLSREREYAEHHYCDPFMRKIAEASAKAQKASK